MDSVFSKTFNGNSRSCFGFCDDGSGSSISHQRSSSPQQDEVGLTSEVQEQKRELDTLLAQAMNGLTFEERQQQEEVLHGVDQVVEEENLLNFALGLLDNELNSIKQTTPGSSYQIAEQTNHKYVHDRAFRVMFLRANEYDPKASADQMVRFLDMKQKLFGESKLTKDITLEDFDQDGMICLKAGCFQLCERDRSGRQVILAFGGLISSFSIQSWLRVQYFVKMKALRSEQTQLRGTVSVWCAMEGLKSSDSKGYVDSYKAARALPLKKAATHICVDETHQATLCNVLVRLMKGNMRARVRVHTGSHTECQYQLSTFGILPQTLRLNSNGSMDLVSHLQLVERWMREDKLVQPQASVGRPLAATTSPNPADVLFAGVKISKHQGNQRFRSLLKEYAQAYDAGTDENKRVVVGVIIGKIHESGGRFLRHESKNDTVWKEVPPNELRKKVMQTFRNRRRLDGPNPTATSSMEGTLIEGRPLPFDVIFGRAQRTRGTDELHRLVKENFAAYESLDRGLKMRLVEEIMQQLKDLGGRFLQIGEDPDKWIELLHDNARERIGKYFRNRRRQWTKKVR